MSKNVLLVAPYVHDFAAFDLWLKPLGLLYVASAVERAGYRVRVVNCMDSLNPSTKALSPGQSSARHHGTGKFPSETTAVPQCLAHVPRRYKRYGIPIDIFRTAVAEGPPPDVIGVGSMMTYWYGGVAETVAILRELWPQVPVVLGGVYATLCPGHAREHSGADIVIEGPGEKKFLDFLMAEIGSGNREPAGMPPLQPAYHLLDNLDSVSMLTSFGCPFSCAYCASRLLRPRFSQRSVDEVVGEIFYYTQKMKIEDIAFYDDALLVNADHHIKPILREVIAKKTGARFHTPNGLHANMIDGELASLMRDCGFATVRLSVESVDESRLRDSCSKVTPTGFERAVSHLLGAGYAPGDIEAYVMMGAPGQKAEEVEQTMRLTHAAGAVVKLADFSPIPGTPYFDTAIREHGLDPAEPLLQNSSILPHIVPGLHEQYRVLKELASRLNAQLRDVNSKPEPGDHSAPAQ
jgi:radical SAM superfamily enzyme YgiQ (UPF0313 family)